MTRGSSSHSRILSLCPCVARCDDLVNLLASIINSIVERRQCKHIKVLEQPRKALFDETGLQKQEAKD